MRKIKEVLRLRNELKLDQRQIARSCPISVSTVHEYLKRAEAAKVGWPLPEGWDDAAWACDLVSHVYGAACHGRNRCNPAVPQLPDSA